MKTWNRESCGTAKGANRCERGRNGHVHKLAGPKGLLRFSRFRPYLYSPVLWTDPGRPHAVDHPQSGSPRRSPGARRPAAVRDPCGADVFVRVPVRGAGALPRGTGLQRGAHRPAAHPHPGGRRPHLPVDHPPRRPPGPEADAGPGRGPHGGCGRALRPQRGLHRAGAGGHLWGHQPLGQRGGPLPGHRAGGAVPGAARGPAHRRLRLVPPGRSLRHRPRRPGRGLGRPGPAGQRAGPRGQLPGPGLRLRRRGVDSRGPLRPDVRGHRGAALGRGDGAPGPAWLQGGGAAPVRPLFAGRLRRGLRHPEPRGLLVPPALRRGAGPAGHHLFRGQHPGGPFSPLRRAPGPAHRAHPHHGLHPRPIERAADPGAPDAQPAPGHRGAAAALQHLADGRPHAAGLHHAGGGTR